MLAYSLSLQHEWCLLLISLVLWATLAPMAPAFPLPDSNPLYQFDGQVRLRHLYTSDEQTVRFLEITLDGKVQHSRYKTPFSEYLEREGVGGSHWNTFTQLEGMGLGIRMLGG